MTSAGFVDLKILIDQVLTQNKFEDYGFVKKTYMSRLL